MKTIFNMFIFLILIITTVLSIPYLVPQKEEIKYNGDDELRKVAFSKGLKSIPKSYPELLKVVDNKKNPMSNEKIELGKELYFDKTLSKHEDISCATCHMISKENNHEKIVLNETLSTSTINPNNCVTCHLGDQSGTDRLGSAFGDEQRANPHHLNTMTILNSSLAKSLTWSGEVRTLEDEVGNSITTSYMMNMKEDELEQKLKQNPKYLIMFEKAFKDEEKSISFENVKKSIASYIRTLLTRGSFDDFLDGDNSAISDEAKRGLVHFMNFGCSGCHTGMSVGGQSVQRFPLRHFAGIYDLRPNFILFPEPKIIDNSFPFENIGGFLGRADTNFFRVPILRNVTKTSPYFHNGSVAKIREAVEIMGRHQLGRNLTNVKIDEIVAFLKTLEGNIIDYSKTRE